MDDPRLRLLGAAEAADAGQLLAALDTVRPIVTVSPDLPRPAAGAALTLVALLSRLFPHVQVDGSAQAGPNPWGITDVAGALDWFRAVRPVPTTAPATDIRMSLGLPAGGRGRDLVLGAGGGDWTVRLGREPQPLDDPPGGLRHGLGLHAAACLAVNELLKVALVPQGMRALMLPGSNGAWCGDPLVWNLIDYRRVPAPLADAGCAQRLRVLLAGAGSTPACTARASRSREWRSAPCSDNSGSSDAGPDRPK